MQLKISIIIPSYNALNALQQTLEKLQIEASEAEIIVVDGGSTDGSKEFVLQCKDIRLLEIQNFGYGHALNRGFEIAQHDIVVLMNSDVLITKNALLMMQQRLLEQPQVGAVGVVPIQKNGQKQRSFGDLAMYYTNYFDIKAPLRVTMLHGYCIATRRDVLKKIGGFDENFFFYNEEYDWCWRALKAGYHLEILPETAIHFSGSSTTQSPNILLEGRRGGMYVINKHFPILIAQATRRFFQLEAWMMSMVEQRKEYKLVWQKLESCMIRGTYLETNFPLSGRGEVHFD
jgi:GT2 family glycosyltransferase